MVKTGTGNGSTPCYSLLSVVLTAQTTGLLSRGSQVRILPAAPVLARTRDSSLLHRLTREHFAGLKRTGRPQILAD